MIASLAIILIALAWLGHETKWLTIRIDVQGPKVCQNSIVAPLTITSDDYAGVLYEELDIMDNSDMVNRLIEVEYERTVRTV